MPSKWNRIRIKKGRGIGNVTEEQKDALISKAVSMWKSMGLTLKQTAFGIATMGVESGFDPVAGGQSRTEKGLGQFREDTWNEAVKHYNNLYRDSLNPALSRYNTDDQIAVIGGWIKKIWPTAVRYSRHHMLSDYRLSEIAYGLWHEGQNAKEIPIKIYLDRRGNEGFDTIHVKDYFNSAYDEADTILRTSSIGEYVAGIHGLGAGALEDLLLPVSKDAIPMTGLEHLDPITKRRIKSLSNGLTINGKETLWRDGDRVWRIEPDGGTRGYFICND
ncbi:MAG: hypothetical protein AAB356_04995 [Deltaproteobacteria bacterium]